MSREDRIDEKEGWFRPWEAEALLLPLVRAQGCGWWSAEWRRTTRPRSARAEARRQNGPDPGAGGGVEWRRLVDAIPAATVRDLRDRALIPTLTYAFAPIGAALAMHVQDVRSHSAGWDAQTDAWRMIRRRAADAGIAAPIGCHTIPPPASPPTSPTAVH